MMKFGRFTIPSHHIFYTSTSSFAFVNLRPILPGHVLVSPKRVVPRLRDLDSQEYTDLWLAVREVQNMLEQHYTPTKDDDKDQVLSFNVAVQDGLGAGQSVPHVHVHLLPRLAGDFERNDDVYDELEQWAPRSDMPKEKLALEVPDDGDRKDALLNKWEKKQRLIDPIF
eukprot:CAMPEP_0202451596 /NCGR_PEP_ID=MMETSP1360-20130828/9997_1 /ASSEMBLY_ACC=CAM_ASM_000848 /TAXON_ID=515479 /ORGANISM="Licmophora paradoxa, Strain CCMP2313" /LENGTH=168 /DNA_ID=CAMNT_0049070201 /DNA_START=206 /DNA_END=713 /DNA_ORIENTATION=+